MGKLIDADRLMDALWQVHHHDGDSPEAEVYMEDVARIVEGLPDGLSEQEQRDVENIRSIRGGRAQVMTLMEVLAAEVVYAEDVDKADIIPVLVDRRTQDRIALVRPHLYGSPSLMVFPLIGEYGKRWRCWTARPTEAQREAVKWE